MITATRLRELVTYNPDTGAMEWILRPGYHKNKKLGPIGTLNSGGYLTIWLDGKHYKIHRLCFLYAYGRWPEPECDHWNGDRTDNRIDNLREVTRSQNQQNARRRRDNSSGHPGVYWHNRNKVWEACIGVGKGFKHVGQFKSFDDAVAARIQAKSELHPYRPDQRL